MAIPPPSSGFGAGGFGAMPWGGGAAGTIDLLAALAVRENVVRLSFSQAVYYSGLLDAPDASIPSKFAMSAVAGGVGMDGSPIRPVGVVAVSVPGPAQGLSQEQVGYFLDLTLDRPMTPYPALYTVAVVAATVFTEDLAFSVPDTALQVAAVYKRIEPPQLETARPSRDIGNAQTLSAARSSLPDPTNPLSLGTLRVDDSGDYAFDEGLVNFKKRIVRRLVTSPGKFAHMPTYGVGIPDHGKKLASSAVITSLAAQAETQISLEPETARVRVRPVVDQNVPGLVKFQVLVRTKVGQAQRFDVPFSGD